MRYDFTFDLEILGATVAQLDGHAVLGKQDGGSWCIVGIVLESFPVGTVDVPADHPCNLRQQIELWLRKHQSAQMDEAWARHRAEQKAEAA